MNKRKAMLIYNGNAGQKNIKKTLGTVVPILSEYIDELIINPTRQKGDAFRLCRHIGEGVDELYILGGDGTVHECINGISPLQSKPAIGILPGGTCNDFLRTLEIPQNIEKAAEALVHGDKAAVDVLKANNHYCLNFWGVGFITEASSHINQTEKALLGRISYFTSALRTIPKLKPFPCKLTIDGEELTDEAVMVLVLNGQFIGTNRLPLPKATATDGKADVLVCRNTSLSALKELLSMDQPEWETFEGDLSYFQGKTIKVETAEEMDADTDGEIYSKAPADINVLNGHLRMLVPGVNRKS
ncbi:MULTISPECIES: YegS/Rv2252/BmrU family lipid kinase [Bacillus]|uniref:YegS/Rv2252/BmrU family lipid kinase n=2 Tax=Bacillus TaxID=1386 RepID=A0AAJ3Z1Q6_9BACI|nr:MULTISPECIES: YegS/Rv2252/BmrU family lipid kinase [Bacillus]KKB71549.1 lipid kinase [Bacillus sp. TH008]MDU0073928.1 YegS/Rv2252/BmrU family lipid kinase [Bacillus sp. IG6]MED8021826.1 YegS/Rv2252/BmrU family lipid kinase [Bacillus glycinifermentans]QAT65975.1 YegS/Rv2252/BmrU family lipid kinase [Bacillus glycinifermentans]WKB75677.1 YegS/Rv2252/BmrU family lipid kinase [Bacillus glycinifermentans]